MRTFLRVVAVLVAVPLLVGLAVVGYHSVGLLAARRQAVAEVAAGLPVATRTATTERAAALDTLADGAPTYRWTELHCSLDSNDAGWMVQDYEQECVVRAVALVPVPTRSTGPGRCEPTDARLPSSGGRPTTAARGQGADLIAPDAAWRMCPTGIVADEADGVTRILDGTRPTTLDGATEWAVVRTEALASSTTLGCSPWSIVFCGRPPGGLALGDVVA